MRYGFDFGEKERRGNFLCHSFQGKPKELFVDAAAGKAISSKPKRGDDYVDYAGKQKLNTASS